MSIKARVVKEKIIEGLVALSGSITSITVLLIIIFLFKEGTSFMGSNTTEEGFVIAVHKSNPIKSFSLEQIKNAYDGKITSWKELGGADITLETFALDKLEKVVKKEELGKDLEFAPKKLAEYLKTKTNVLVYLPESYFKEVSNEYTKAEVEKVTLSNFLLGKEWFPTAEPAGTYGALSLILGTLWVSVGAIIFALPLGIATAIFMAELAGDRLRNILKPIVELLAGIPSVVYGFFGLIVIVPFIKNTLGLDAGETGLAGSIILGIMALPTIITISEDAIKSTPRAQKEASLALGATHWQTIRKVVLPYSSSGITAALVLGIGRAIGETMSVLMVTGNAAIIPTTYLAPLRTIPATIAAELGEAPYGGTHFQSLFALGCILFVITFIINISFEFIIKKNKNS